MSKETFGKPWHYKGDVISTLISSGITESDNMNNFSKFFSQASQGRETRSCTFNHCQSLLA